MPSILNSRLCLNLFDNSHSFVMFFFVYLAPAMLSIFTSFLFPYFPILARNTLSPIVCFFFYTAVYFYPCFICFIDYRVNAFFTFTRNYHICHKTISPFCNDFWIRQIITIHHIDTLSLISAFFASLYLVSPWTLVKPKYPFIRSIFVILLLPHLGHAYISTC